MTKHYTSKLSYLRLLCVDFSSAFNTMQPHILVKKLRSYFHLDHQLIRWIICFLTNRTQTVVINGRISKQRSLLQLNTEQVLNKAEKIISNHTHDVLYDYFNLIPSGMCFTSPACKTNRRKFGFIPEAIRLVNPRNDLHIRLNCCYQT